MPNEGMSRTIYKNAFKYTEQDGDLFTVGPKMVIKVGMKYF